MFNYFVNFYFSGPELLDELEEVKRQKSLNLNPMKNEISKADEYLLNMGIQLLPKKIMSKNLFGNKLSSYQSQDSEENVSDYSRTKNINISNGERYSNFMNYSDNINENRISSDYNNSQNNNNNCINRNSNEYNNNNKFVNNKNNNYNNNYNSDKSIFRNYSSDDATVYEKLPKIVNKSESVILEKNPVLKVPENFVPKTKKAAHQIILLEIKRLSIVLADLQNNEKKLKSKVRFLLFSKIK